MTGVQDSQLERAVADAVDLVNAHAGRACVRLRFRNSGECGNVALLANSATLQGDRFSFRAGFETVDGTIAELADISAELIGH
jgi:hypothetical protein